VEPEYYLPVVPLLAINGSVGIGTGYSTDIPPYKPDDMVCLLRHRLEGSIDSLAGRPLDPWWFGFKGVVQRQDDQTWITKGIYAFDDDKKTVTITELPAGTWTKDYKAFLDVLYDAEEKKSKAAKAEAKKAETGSTTSAKGEVEPCGLKGFDDLYNDVDVRFILYFTEEGYDALKDNVEKFEKQFKLTSSWKTTNMTCFDTDFNIVKYKTIGDVMETFVQKRLPMYEARRVMMMENLEKQMRELDAKRRFLQALLDERLVLSRRSDEDIVAQLKACEIPALSNMDLPDAYDSYDFVLRMRMDRVKQSAVVELDGQIGEKGAEIVQLQGETGSSMWLADLEEFRLAWVLYSQERVASATSVAKSAPTDSKKKRPAIKK
jgi:DNA topoisomerase-2